MLYQSKNKIYFLLFFKLINFIIFTCAGSLISIEDEHSFIDISPEFKLNYEYVNHAEVLCGIIENNQESIAKFLQTFNHYKYIELLYEKFDSLNTECEIYFFINFIKELIKLLQREFGSYNVYPIIAKLNKLLNKAGESDAEAIKFIIKEAQNGNHIAIEYLEKNLDVPVKLKN